jgi:uncharacterized phage-like protein YoqJ
MSEREHTLCFTGHRYYNGSAEEQLALAIETAYGDGYRVFISGMAEGFDLAAAEAILKLKESQPNIALVAAVPFSGQAKGFSPTDKARYEVILAMADQIVILREHYTHGCYWERDDWMVEHSRRVICWYDSSGGGTRYTVRAALAAGLDIVNIFSSSDTLF